MHYGDYPYQALKIPYENYYLHGYLFLNHQPESKPTIISPSGYDSFAEELYFGAQGFVARGFNAFVFDGSGQGRSFGGFLTHRAEASGLPLRALICDPGQWDMIDNF